MRGSMPQRFGEKLRFLRQQSGLSQAQLADQVGLTSRSHVANLESGRDVPSLIVVVHIAQRLGVTIDSLLRDDREVEAAEFTVGFVPEAGSARSFGTKLQALRQRQRQSQRELVTRLGLVSRAYISDLESGRKLPSIDFVVQLADLFGVTTDYLLQDDIPISGANG
jgi:transcriptional regulator with XRE-family HTH domain